MNRARTLALGVLAALAVLVPAATSQASSTSSYHASSYRAHASYTCYGGCYRRPGLVYVHGYIRRSGTYVRPYVRRYPLHPYHLPSYRFGY
jgi:hypothetical protein